MRINLGAHVRGYVPRDVIFDQCHLPVSLTIEGQRMLAQLRDEADALMVRKAHAYALLHSRGYTLPALEDLRTQTA
jgi:hypothetical protein